MTPAIYVFNFTNDNGFLFVSADYRLRPVLAFIERGNFKKDTVPPGLIQWAGKTVNDIEIVRKGLYDNASIAKKEWRAYIENGSLMSGNVDNATSNPDMLPPPPDDNPCISDPNYYTSTTQTVGPLLPVTWGQDCSYNELCPNNNCNDCSPRAVTGCVATAMAQVIRYWQPSTSFSYNYASMPATSGNGEVQRLMHDAGVKVSMDYGCAANGGSAADGGDVPGALKNWFGLTSASRSSYGSSSYLTVKSNLSSSRLVLLEGCNDQTNVFL